MPSDRPVRSQALVNGRRSQIDARQVLRIGDRIRKASGLARSGSLPLTHRGGGTRRGTHAQNAATAATAARCPGVAAATATAKTRICGRLGLPRIRNVV